ncbi:MAG: DoxX family protein [Tannerella sp.]|jgi:uncharacterized membrane protein YphA (DoxX/SURF4 family)|nr:DoxX family protein [Tannerella sp.]
MKAIDYRKIITEICRIILGATFLFSGTVKAIDPVGGGIKIEEYFGAFGLTAFNPVATLISVNLSAVEFMLGVCILMAVYRKLTTICILAFMSFMTLLSLYLAIFNPVHDCGCFGEAFILTNWQTFFKNFLILLPASVMTFVYHTRMTPVYTYKAYWFAVFFAYIFPVWFSYYNYSHLPIEDFRPYKTGANIPALMSFPEDAQQDEYQYIYEKNGEKKAFTPESAPADDPAWTYVEAKLVKPGYVPPITSFEIYNHTGDNIAEDILSAENGVFLLVSAKIEKASDKKIDEINNIYDYAQEHKIPFYCVTSSAEEYIKTWINDTGAEYPFLTADDVTLKTIIRANPGLVLIKSGTILKKWHYNDIPSEDEANAVIDRLLNSPDKNTEKENSPWTWIIGCFTLPLLLVWIYDCLRNRRKLKPEKDEQT